MNSLIYFLLNFLDFWFLPLVIALIVSVVVEQVIRRKGSDAAIFTAMRIRKFLYTQNVILNFVWFLSYFIFVVIMRPSMPVGDPMASPDLLWNF